jgi:phosphate-selective porin OprO/OprP
VTPPAGEATDGAPRAAAPPAAVRVRREPHATVIESDRGRLVLATHIQFQLDYEKPNGTLQLPGTPEPGAGKGAFKVRRAKTSLDGWFWKREITYKLQLAWSGADAGTSTLTPLEDARLTYDVSKTGAFAVTIGQFKVPLGRQELTTSDAQQFVDRSLLSGEVTRGRDTGIMVGGLLKGGKLEYQAGIFNGNPASRMTNDNQKFQYNARVVFQPLGALAYREGDIESSARPLVALAAQWEHNDLHGATNANDLLTIVLGAELAVKYRGFSLFGEYFHRDREPEQGPSFASPGFNVQAGVFVVPKRLEVALRLAGCDPSDALPGNDRREKGVAATYFIDGHDLKIQADFRRLEDDGLKRRSHVLRLQTQFVF